MHTQIKATIAVFLAFLAITVWAKPVVVRADAGAFNPNLIINDENLLDFSRMSVDQIQAFLAAHSGPLAAYSVTLPDASTQTAAQVIYTAAQTYQINPQYILTTLQKEESLIDGGMTGATLQTHLDWAMGFGVCDSCSISDPSIQAFKGFYNQINSASKQVRKYLNDLASRGYTVSGWGPGITKTLTCIGSDASRGLCTAGQSITVTPANNATAVLYTYTPHPGGNYSYWTLWNAYSFAFQRFYPDGSLMQVKGSKDTYLLQYGVLRKFKNLSVLLSRYSASSILTVTAADLLPYAHGPDINYPNYSLLSSPKGGIYLLVDDTKRAITSSLAFKTAGFAREEVIKATWNDLNQYATGVDITPANVFPSGALVQNPKGAVFQLKEGVLHAIYTKDIMRSQFGFQKPSRITAAKFATFSIGAPLVMRDGTLMQSKQGGSIYVMSDGVRLPINSMAIFTSYHYNTKNVLRVDQATVDMAPLGPPLDSLSSPVQLAGGR